MKKFLVIGGLHGNEPLGLEVCRRLEKLKLPYIDVLYGNPTAIKKNIRFIDEDLNRVFPGNPKGSLEAKRASEIMKICRKYDFVIDFHNTYCPDNDCTFLGSKSREAFQLPGFLGLDKIVLADAYDSINKYVTNCLSVEISLNSKAFDVDLWIQKMVDLKNYNPSNKYNSPKVFEFVYRITSGEQDKFKFPKWEAFKRVLTKDLKPLSIAAKEKLYAIFIDDKYTPYNYAALLKRSTTKAFLILANRAYCQ